mmetsp:Transcript_122440/g.391783  ORF Transcript_122440/g.391783 Transcript_122440/m.391783 type:complete len:353 (-) Transcript_122440:149-1207(-)
MFARRVGPVRRRGHVAWKPWALCWRSAGLAELVVARPYKGRRQPSGLAAAALALAAGGAVLGASVAGGARGGRAQCEDRGGLKFHFEPKPGQFSPLYLRSPERSTAACNAGDYWLYLGGGSINGAFAKLLGEVQNLEFTGAHRKGLPLQKDYQELHILLLRESRERSGALVSARRLPQASALLSASRLVDCYAVAGEAIGEEEPAYTASVGSVFVDVFDGGARPLHERNVAMLYVVGPKGEGAFAGQGPLLARDHFLGAVRDLGKRAMLAVAQYNADQSTRLPRDRLPVVEEVRWCLVSGGVFRHKDTSKLEVARATLEGMLSVPASGVMVTFTYDEDCFRLAYESLEQAKL